MVQVLPISQQALDAAEDVEELIQMASADGVITEQEIAFLLPRVTQLVVMTREADLARAAGMAVIKGGVGAKRAQDLLHQIDERWGEIPA